MNPDAGAFDFNRAISEDTFVAGDFYLFHNFMTTTIPTISEDPADKSPWTTAVPSLALRHPYLLHEMLAVSAIQLSQSNGIGAGQSDSYIEAATTHHDRALGLFRVAIAAYSEETETAGALFACSALFVLYYFTAATDPTSLLFNKDLPGPPEWVTPLRGCRALWRQSSKAVDDTPMGPLLRQYTGPFQHPDLEEHFVSKPYLVELQQALVVQPEHRDVYDSVLRELMTCFAISSKPGSAVYSKVAALRFLAGASDEFLLLVKTKQQPALVIMSFWCVLMHWIRGHSWLSSDKVKGLMRVLLSELSAEWKALVRWPTQEILGED